MVKPVGESVSDADLGPRERLVAATEELIGEVGWGRVTTRQVAGRAGVNHALIHYYFGSLETLMAKAAEESVTAVFEQMDALVLGSPDLGEGIHDALTWLGALNRRGGTWAAYADLLAHCQRDPRLREQYVEATAELRAAVSSRLRGRARRRTKDGVALTVVAALDGLLAQYLLDPTLDLDAAADALASLVDVNGRTRRRPG